MLDVDHCYLCVRDQNADQSPVLSDIAAESFSVLREHGGWFTVTRNVTGRRFLAWRANTNAAGTRALFAIFAPLVVLQKLAAVEPLCAPARTVWTLAQGGNATAIAIVRRWPVWRWSGSARHPVTDTLTAVNNVVTRLIFEGQTLPAPPLPSSGAPWRFAESGAIVGTDGASEYRVTSLVRPAFRATMGEHLLDTKLEDEPE